MLGNKRRLVVSGRLNFPSRKVRPLPAWIDKDPVLEGLSGIEMDSAMQDAGIMKKIAPVGKRCASWRSNRETGVSINKYDGGFYMDNQAELNTGLTVDGNFAPAVDTSVFMYNGEYFRPQLGWLARDKSGKDTVTEFSNSMPSWKIGLVGLQVHGGSYAGSLVGQEATSTAVAVGAWAEDERYVPGEVQPFGYVKDSTGSIQPMNMSGTNAAMTVFQNKSLGRPGVFWNMHAFQWNPIGVGIVEGQKWDEITEKYQKFRFTKFGMRIDILDAPFFEKESTGAIAVNHGEVPTFNQTNIGTGIPGNAQPGGSLDAINTNPGTLPKQSQRSGVAEYMVIGRDHLQNIDIASLMGYQASDATVGIEGPQGVEHIWSSLVERGFKVHRMKPGQRSIKLSWKPSSVTYTSDMLAVDDYTEPSIGPIGPVVNLYNVVRHLPNQSLITPAKYFADPNSTDFTNCMKTLSKSPYNAAYNFFHYGPVVIVRCMSKAGATLCPAKATYSVGGVNYTTDHWSLRCNRLIPEYIPYTVTCWARWQAFEERTKSFKIFRSEPFPSKLPLPALLNSESALANARTNYTSSGAIGVAGDPTHEY